MGQLLVSFGMGLLSCVLLDASLQDDEQLRGIWQSLDADKRARVCTLLRLECRKLPTSQAKTIYWVVDNEPVDAGFFRPAAKPRLYHAEEHAPGYAVPRTALEESDPRLLEKRDQLLPKLPQQHLRKAYGYDWSSGEVVLLGDPSEAQYIFENALNGYYPDQDLALAITLKDLDDGSERKGLAAFAHTYAMNEGEVFPGITLFDAFLSGQDVDFPDVDALGLLHDTIGDWDTWLTPIRDQAGIYAVLRDEFQAIKNYRHLREALADAFFLAQPFSSTGFDVRRTQLHALWVKADFEPSKLRELLPRREEHEAFLRDMTQLSSKESGIFARARLRETQFQKDKSYLRRVLQRTLQKVESGAL